MFQKAIIAVIFLFVIVAGYNLLTKSPDKLIKLTLNKIEDKASFNQSSHPFERLKLAKELANNFTENVEVEFKTPEKKIKKIYGHDQLVKFATVSGNYLESVSLSFKDINIDLQADKASVSVTALVDAIRKGGDRERYAQELEFNFVNQNDVWLISGGKNVDLIDR